MSKKMRKMIIAGVLLLLLSPMPTVLSEELSTINREIYKNKASKEITNDTEYYAVIASCSIYQDASYNIPKAPFKPISNEKSSHLYNALIEKENWHKQNIIFLVNEQATKQNITDALINIAEKADENDIFLFAWSGHGSMVEDLDGDEKQQDPDDNYDEIICPYDINIENNSIQNYLTDDELNILFNKIIVKGMCLIFESCLSGGLISNTSRDSTSILDFNEDLKIDLRRKQSNIVDIDDMNRIIIMSTLPNTIGRASYLFGWPLMHSLGLSCSKFCQDKNDDGILSAEEIFSTASYIYTIESSLVWIGMFCSLVVSNKLGLYKGIHIPFFENFPKLHAIEEKLNSIPMKYPIIVALFQTCFQYLYIKEYLKQTTGLNLGNTANIYDGYDTELPLMHIS